MTQEAGKSKPVLVLEDITDKGTEWGISFQDPNPEALYYFRMPDKETAFRLQKAIHEYAQQIEQPWVRVEPGCEMPGKMEDCLFCNIDIRDMFGEKVAPISVNSGWYQGNGIFKSWLDPRDNFNPTHWKPMPLPPAPPKQ